MDYTFFYKYCYHTPEELAGEVKYDVFVSFFAVMTGFKNRGTE